MVRTWMGWSAKHKWVSRSLARDEWIAHVSDEQIVVNVKACMLALATKAHDFLKSPDSADFLRAARVTLCSIRSAAAVTTVAAAQKLGRQWIGIDVTNLAK